MAHDLRVELPFRDGIHHMSMFREGYTSSPGRLSAGKDASPTALFTALRQVTRHFQY
jgi:hypothetical protein